MLEIHIKGDPKEIAALVLELQERQCLALSEDLANGIIQCLQSQQGQGEQAVLR